MQAAKNCLDMVLFKTRVLAALCYWRGERLSAMRGTHLSYIIYAVIHRVHCAARGRTGARAERAEWEPLDIWICEQAAMMHLMSHVAKQYPLIHLIFSLDLPWQLPSPTLL